MNNKVKINNLLAAQDARLEELESKMTGLAELELNVQQQQKRIVDLQQKMDERPANSILSQVAINPISSGDSNDKTAVAAADMPKSCADVRFFGQTVTGLYLIMGTEKVETVFCDFTLIPSDPSNIIFISTVIKLIYLSTTRCRFSDFDRTSRRKITACLLLRSEN